MKKERKAFGREDTWDESYRLGRIKTHQERKQRDWNTYEFTEF